MRSDYEVAPERPVPDVLGLERHDLLAVPHADVIEADVRLDPDGSLDRSFAARGAVEAARLANGWTDTRPHLAHIQVVHPDDVPRFGALRVTANAQPLWAAYEPQMAELTIPFIGEALAIGGVVMQDGDLRVAQDLLHELHREESLAVVQEADAEELFVAL